MRKVKFKCSKCNSTNNLLSDIHYDESCDEFYAIYETIKKEIKLDQDNFMISCACGESHNLQDIKNYEIKLNRENKINNIL